MKLDFTWVTELLHNFVTWILSSFISSLQTIFDSLLTFVIYFVSLFPDCMGAAGSCAEIDVAALTPVASSVWGILLITLNWLFPISFFINIINFMTCGIMALIIIMPVARWLKLIT